MTDLAAQAEAETAREKPYDTSDPEAVNEVRKRAGRQRRAQLDMVGAIMETVQGRAWCYAFLAAGHVFEPSYTPGDPHATSFREGERNMALRLLADIQSAAADQYIAMVREASGR